MITAGIVAAAIAGGGVAGAVLGIPGLSGASTSSTTSPHEAPEIGGHFHRFGLGDEGHGIFDAAAKALNLSTPDLFQKLSDGKTTIADIAAQQKVPVQTVIDAMDAVAKTDISNLVNNPLPMGPKMGDRGPIGPGFGMHRGFGGLDDVAKALGISTQTLMSDLRNGQSIAAIAKANNKDVNGLIDTLVNDATSKIDAAVKAGDLTKDEATAVKSGLKDRITGEVNGTFPKFGRGRGLRHRFGAFAGPGGRGWGGPGRDGPGWGGPPVPPAAPNA